MKKILFASSLCLSLVLLVSHAHAQSCSDFTNSSDCTDVGGQQYVCEQQADGTGKCVAAAPGAAGGLPQGATCDQNNDQCGGGLVCGSDNTCQSDGSAVGTTDTGGGGGGSGGGPNGFVPLAPIPGLDQTIAPGTGGIATFLNNLYIYLIGIAAAIAVIEVIWGGIEISIHDSVVKHRDGVHRIQQALIGLALVLLPALVFTIINPAILNLNINMPSLNLDQYSSGNTGGGGGGGSGSGSNTLGSGTPSKNGCNTATGNEYKQASCGTDQAAQDYMSTNCPYPYGSVTGGTCTGGFSPSGTCLSGDYANVQCAGVSPNTYTFVNTDTGDQSPIVNFSSYHLQPITADKSGVQGYVSACSTGKVCVTNHTSVGTCAKGSYNFATKYSNPQCLTANVVCSNDSQLGCDDGYILIAN